MIDNQRFIGNYFTHILLSHYIVIVSIGNLIYHWKCIKSREQLENNYDFSFKYRRKGYLNSYLNKMAPITIFNNFNLLT